MKLTIKDREIEIKNKMRAYLIYEQFTEKNFNPKTLTEILIYFYSLIIANDKDIQLTFEEFVDYIDENQNVFAEFNKWLIGETEMRKQSKDVKKKTDKK